MHEKLWCIESYIITAEESILFYLFYLNTNKNSVALYKKNKNYASMTKENLSAAKFSDKEWFCY